MPSPTAPTYTGPPRTPGRLVAQAICAVIAQRKARRLYAEVLIASEAEWWTLYEHFTRLNVGYAVRKTTLGYSQNIVIISWTR
ncbi:MAG: hypothetical protein ACRYFR_04955 [Janthinobacterium lividum]